MLACKRRCRKCYPNGCCGFCRPPPVVQQQTAMIIDVKTHVEQKDIRYGHIQIYPGVRTSENKYTCPMLSIHLYRHSQHKSDVARDRRTVNVYGNNQQQTYQGPKEYMKLDKSTADGEIFMLPVEDITSIMSNLEVKRGIEADIKSELVPTYELSENCCDRCCDTIKGCCRSKEVRVVPLFNNTTTIIIPDDPNRNTNNIVEDQPIPPEKKGCFDRCRCWCCRKNKLVSLIKKTKIASERQAQRVITVTIEYSKYSNLDTPTHTRLLNNDNQLNYYKEKFEAHKELKFYLANNTEFDATNFELKTKEAETLCRTIMQLKAMRDHYPSEHDLDGILDQSYRRSFGDTYKEPILQIPLEQTPTPRRDLQTQGLPQPSQRPAIQPSQRSTMQPSQQPVIQPSQRPAIQQSQNPVSTYREEENTRVVQRRPE